VADSVPLALFCAQEISSAGIDVILARAISLGGDTDTIASITGQIAGCVVGSGGVPQSLLRNVEGMREVEAIACAFADFVVKRVGT
jgi:ADP-ribosylglycohydrolase